MVSCDQHPLRRLAILVASVDAEAARFVLQQLPTGLAQQVRRQAAELGTIPPGEHQAIVAELRAVALSAPSSTPPEPAGLPAIPDTQAGREVPQGGEAAHVSVATEVSPSRGWQSYPLDALAEALAEEDAEAIATVLSELESATAASILNQLGAERNCEVLRALSQPAETAESVREAIRHRLQNRIASQASQSAPPQIPATVSDNKGQPQGQPVHNSATAASRGSSPSESSTEAASQRAATAGGSRVRDLDDLLDLPRTLLAEVMNGCDSETVLLALAGASPRFIERFYSILQPADAQQIERRLKSIGGLKLSDIDQAQVRLLQAAERRACAQRKSA